MPHVSACHKIKAGANQAPAFWNHIPRNN